jgi:hypothetical protein
MTTNDSEGRGSLRNHLPSHTAPPQLHDRVRRTLASRQHSPRRPQWLRWASAAAAAAVIFTVGFATGRTSSSTPAATPIARYALLLYGGHETPTEAEGARAAEYGRWAATMNGATFVSGEELGDVVGQYGVQTLPTPGSPPPGEPVAGFFLIDAPDDTAAITVARDCPHLKYGGRVVLQKIPRAG